MNIKLNTEVAAYMTRMGDDTNAAYLLKILLAATAKSMPHVTEYEAAMLLATLRGVVQVEDVDPDTFAQSLAADVLDANPPEECGLGASAFADRIKGMSYEQVAALVTAAEFFHVAKQRVGNVRVKDYFLVV